MGGEGVVGAMGPPPVQGEPVCFLSELILRF